ncbi:MAG: hypothetical protein J6P72_07870, partial [Firmicutes bacterium]|nr:hypothetical protein [Bacillota bacterium]
MEMEKTGTIPSGGLGQMDGAALYSIFNPTGNITALVENSQNQVPVPLQPEVAAEIMRRHPEVEQVGFVSFPKGDGRNGISESCMVNEADGLSGIRMANEADGLSGICMGDKAVRLPELRMAGGEFCGNASMCAAAYYSYSLRQAGLQEPSEVLLQVSGAALPVQVNLKRNGEHKWAASIKLPPAKSIETVSLSWEGGRLEQQELRDNQEKQERQEQHEQQEQQEQQEQ